MWPFVLAFSWNPFNGWKDIWARCYQLLGCPCSFLACLEASLSRTTHLHQRSKTQLHLKCSVNGWLWQISLAELKGRLTLHVTQQKCPNSSLFLKQILHCLSFPFHLQKSLPWFSNTWTLAYSSIYFNYIPCCMRTHVICMLLMHEVHWPHM